MALLLNLTVRKIK